MDLIVALRLALSPARIEEPYGSESCACGTLLYYFHVCTTLAGLQRSINKTVNQFNQLGLNVNTKHQKLSYSTPKAGPKTVSQIQVLY